MLYRKRNFSPQKKACTEILTKRQCIIQVKIQVVIQISRKENYPTASLGIFISPEDGTEIAQVLNKQHKRLHQGIGDKYYSENVIIV